MAELVRVLHVLGCLDRGGAETMIMNLYRSLDRTAVQFDFVVHTAVACAFDHEVELLGGKIFRIARYTGSNHFTYIRQWNAFFAAHPEYKIIHGHVRSTAAIYLWIARQYGLKTIAHSHSISSGYGLASLVKDILQYPIRFIADYLVACSGAAGKWLFGAKACRNQNFYIFKNAIDTKQFIYNEETRRRKRQELNVAGQFVIGHVGRFHRSKNHEFLLDIFQVVHANNPQARLLLVGDGELRAAIEHKVHALGVAASVMFAGVRADVPELLQAMDVLVFPSLYEGLAIVILEAQAAGLTCFVSENVPQDVGISPLVQFIPRNRDEKYWAEMILPLAAGRRRENMYEQIVKAGYDIQETVAWIQNFYLSLR